MIGYQGSPKPVAGKSRANSYLLDARACKLTARGCIVDRIPYHLATPRAHTYFLLDE
ncbi:hypothetical protein RSAG8_03317, partial [Rhizoctonia solani AG-8 WAC10335]